MDVLCIGCWTTPHWVVTGLVPDMKTSCKKAGESSSERGSGLHGEFGVGSADLVVPQRDQLSWALLMSRHTKSGQGRQALQIYHDIRKCGEKLSSETFVAAFKACRSLQDLESGRKIHGHVAESGLDMDATVATALVRLYAKCGSLVDARLVFEKMNHHDVVLWNAIILGYAQMEKGDVALQLYAQMQHEGVVPNDQTFVGALKACSSMAASKDRRCKGGDGSVPVRTWCLDRIRSIHLQAVNSGLESDVSVGNMLVDAYCKCGSLMDARRVFEKMPRRTVVSWTAMISGYAQMEEGETGLQLYARMRQEGVVPDDRTFVSALKACSCLAMWNDSGEKTRGGMHVKERCLEQVRAIHSDVLKSGCEADVFVGTMLVDVYAKGGRLLDARAVFEKIPHRNVVSWNAMILGYAQMEEGEEALQLFTRMQQEGVIPDVRTFVATLKACSSLAALKEGSENDVTLMKKWCLEQVRAIHSRLVKREVRSDVFVGTMLVDVYAKCGSLVDARRVFENMLHRNVVSWTAMILGYVQMGEGNLALELFTRMQQEGVTPDDRTFVAALKACGAVAGLDKGKELHAKIAKSRLDSTFSFVLTSLIDMYAKCGSMENAQQVFDELPSRDVVTWNALIAGYAHQGQSTPVFQLFEKMKQEGIQPDSTTLLSILSVCSHVGLVDKGQQCFEDMKTEYDINPTRDHFTCMIDLLGRAGLVDKAMMMAKTMPFQPDSAVWQTMLGACRKWSNVELGREAFEYAVGLDETDAAPYVLMSNIYEAADMWEDAMKIQLMRVKTQALKQPGQSQWTDIRGIVHAFAAGDTDHPDSWDIYANLQGLYAKLKKEGYVLRGTSDIANRGTLSGHSKKMAITYSVLKRTEGTTTCVCGRLLRRSQEPVEVASHLLVSTFLGRAVTGSHIPFGPVLQKSTKGLTDWKHCRDSQLHPRSPNLGQIWRKSVQVSSWENLVGVTKVSKKKMSSKKVCRDRLCSRAGNVVYTHPLRKDEFSWTALISQHVKSGKGRKALAIYKEMREGGTRPSSYTFIAVLKACKILQDLETARHIHCEAVKSGFESDVFVGNMLVDVYAKCGSLVDARHLFEKMSHRNVVSWNAIILGYAQRQEGEVALQLYARMQHEGVVPNDRTFVGALKACSSLAAFEGETEAHKVLVTNRRLAEVRAIHSQVMQSQFESDVFVATTLVDLYAKCGSMVDARQLFEKMSNCNAVAWTAMILGYAETAQGEIGLQLYARMKLEGVVPDARVFVGALKACSSVAAMGERQSGVAILVRERCLEHVRAIHSDVLKGKFESDVFVGNMLVDVYAKCGSLVDARAVFDRMPQRNVISWNTMILGYAHMGEGEVGLQLYAEMQKEGVVPSDRTFVGALKACTGLAALKERSAADGILATKQCLEQVKVIHSHIRKSGIKFDVFLGTTLVDLYAKCGSMVDARCVFEKMPHRNVVSWTTMIVGYAQVEDGEVALQLYREMQNKGVVPDARAFVGALRACSSLAAFEQGENDDEIHYKNQCLEQVRAIHADVVKGEMETDIFVANMLVDAYAKCGSLVDGRHVFEKILNRNVVSWSAMILGYAQMEEGEVALQLYTRMQQEGVVPNDRTFVGALKACTVVAGLEMGRKIHAQISKTLPGAHDLYLASSLIDMYGKCGSMVDAQLVFDTLPTPDIVTWNALIAGYARQGESGPVFDLFEQMKQGGTQPEVSTFVSILTVCSSAGLLTKGQEYFEAMSKDFGIAPTLEHYACMVDLLARAGQVNKAMAMVNSMPYQPDILLWITVLGACQTWCNVELGRHAFECAIRLDRSDAAAYVLMSNIYAAAQMWEAAQEMRTRRATLGAWKQPGQSWWTDVRGTAHVYLVGDTEHSESQHIYSELRNLAVRMEDEGIHPPSSVSRDKPDGTEHARNTVDLGNVQALMQK